jgi:hypothetical protein
VNRILDEKTGRLLKLGNASIVLEGVYCQARYSDCRMFCPRAIDSYWREIWLERVAEGKAGETGPSRPGRREPADLVLGLECFSVGGAIRAGMAPICSMRAMLQGRGFSVNGRRVARLAVQGNFRSC